MIVYIFDNYGGIWELTDVFIKNTKKVPVELMAYNIYIKRSITIYILKDLLHHIYKQT